MNMSNERLNDPLTVSDRLVTWYIISNNQINCDLRTLHKQYANILLSSGRTIGNECTV